MISVIENDGVFFEAIVLQFLEFVSHHLIHFRDHVVVLGPILATSG